MELTRLPSIPENVSDPAEALSELKSYVIRLDRILSVILSDLGEENLGTELKAELLERPKAEISLLKDEIIRTAKEITAFRDSVLLTLSNKYVAKSDIGSYAEEAFQRIEIDGKGITQYFEEVSELSSAVGRSVSDSEAGAEAIGYLRNELTKLGSYIRTGKLCEGVYGIEIGNFSGNGASDYKVRLSENRLSFFIGTSEVAYFSDNMMYINNAVFPSSLSVGGCALKNRNGLTVTCF